MKRIILLSATIALVVSVYAENPPASSGSRSSSGAQSRAYTGISKTYTLLPWKDGEVPLGISPDGKTLAVYVYADYADDHQAVKFLNSADLSVKGEIALPDRFYWLRWKKAVWSPDGRYVIFRKTGRFPAELIEFRSSCIFAVDTLTMSIVQLSDEGYRPAPGKTPFDTPIYYDPSFAPDGRSIVYQRLTAAGYEVVRVNIADKSPRVIFRDSDRSSTIDAMLLSERYLLVRRDDYRLDKPRTLSVQDVSTGTVRVIYSLDSSPQNIRILDIHDASEDRRSILVHVWKGSQEVGDMGLSDVIQIRFNPDFTDQEIHSLVAPKDEHIVNGAQTPDGRTVIFGTVLSDGRILKVKYFLLDIQSNSTKLLFTNEGSFVSPGVYANPLTRFEEGLTLTRDKMLIRFDEGYRIYNLE
jgi:hypothetical protein